MQGEYTDQIISSVVLGPVRMRDERQIAVSDPWDHPYILLDQTALPSLLPSQQENSAQRAQVACRSRAQPCEMVSTDQDGSQGHYVSGLDDAVEGPKHRSCVGVRPVSYSTTGGGDYSGGK